MGQRKIRLRNSSDLTSVISDGDVAKIFHFRVTIDEETGKRLEEERFEEGLRLVDKVLFSYFQEGSKEIIVQECFDKTGRYIGKLKITKDPSSIDDEVVEVYDATGNLERRVGGICSTEEIEIPKDTTKDATYLAVLGDLHGHYTLAWTLLKRWEKETGKTLTAALQVGDMGIFPYPFLRLDKATKRFAEQDSDEISFPDFLEGKGDAQLLFGGEKPAISCPIYFVRGNHEDFEFLSQYDNRDGVAFVDRYAHLGYIPDGNWTEIRGKKGSLIIAALGGKEQKKARNRQPYHFTNTSTRHLEEIKGIDILLTHQPPQGYFGDDIGSERIRELLLELEPTYHFCGDLHIPGQQIVLPCRTQSYILNEVNFRGNTSLNPRCIGILEWGSSTDHQFSFLEESWFQEFTRANYREKLRELFE